MHNQMYSHKKQSRGGRLIRFTVLAVLSTVALGGCASIERAAISMVADSMTSGGGTVFTGDDDPDFVQDATPFGVKFMESLLESVPKHEGLMMSLAQSYTGYAFMLQQDADFANDDNWDLARDLRSRASKHFLRANTYALRVLNQRYPGFSEALDADREAALAQAGQEDAAALFWAGASWSGAVNTARDNLSLMADLGIAAALVSRVLEIDEDFDQGAAHAFMISYEGGRPGGSAEVARYHYRRALELSRGKSAGVHLALAEAVVVKEQDLEEFNALLDVALAVDPDEVVSLRLLNTLAQERARWLKTKIPDLFLLPDETETLSENAEPSSGDASPRSDETDGAPESAVIMSDIGES